MRILTAYVLSDMLKVFLMTLTGMTLFILMVGLFREAYLEGLGLKQVLLLIPYVLPDALRFSVPATILFAACSVFGRLASSNEIIAVKASGISPMVLITPALVLAFLVSLVGVWLNDVAVSWGRDGMARVVIESVEEIAYTRLRQQGSYSAKQFSINVKEVVDDKLINPVISFQGGDDELPTTINCEEATMKTDRAENTLTLTCRNGSVETNVGSMAFPDSSIQRVISLDDASRKGGGTRSTSDMPMCAIPEERIAQKGRIQTLQQQLAAKAAYQMIAGDFTALSATDWNRNDKQLIEAQQRLYRLEMEPHRRWANGFSCLCFVVLGVPLAIRRRNADFLTSFFMCFLPILILYYPLLMFGVSQAKSGSFPPWGVWAGNAILLLIGWHSIRNVCRY